MNIALIGAGIVGVTTAYELAQQGHQVTVFEKCGAAAEQASFAPGGLIAPSHANPWMMPDVPSQVLRQVLRRSAPLKLGARLSPQEAVWLWRWWRAGSPSRRPAQWAQLQQLALYSQRRLQALREELHLDYERSEGCLVMLRTPQQAQAAQDGLQALKDLGIQAQLLNPDGVRAHEPALNPDTDLAGALYLPGGETGNCRQFALLLKTEAQRLGVQFEFGQTIRHIEAGPPLRLHLVNAPQPLAFHAVIVCAGVESARLLRPLGVKVPLVGVQGYSVSAQIREPLNAPRHAIVDEARKASITRLGQRIRVAGGAELGRGPLPHLPTLRALYQVLQDWFPGAARMAAGVQEWKGVQPMLPDAPPLVGASGVPGVWMNLGHGPSGWTLASGSARLLADQLSGHTPDLDPHAFSIQRYH